MKNRFFKSVFEHITYSILLVSFRVYAFLNLFWTICIRFLRSSSFNNSLSEASAFIEKDPVSVNEELKFESSCFASKDFVAS